VEIQEQLWSNYCLEINKGRGWLKFLGIIAIISGAINVLTVVGIIYAWIPIWIGVIMLQASNRGQEFINSKDPEKLNQYLERVSFFYKLSGIMVIVSIALTIIFMIIWAIVGFSFMKMGMGQDWGSFY
jgi:hypothetical protein